MRAIQIKLYSYEELSPEAQKVAREQWEQDDREAGSPSACEIVNEDFEQAVGDAGYPTDNIQWSLSYCQGDGMAFYGKEDVDSKMLDRLVPATSTVMGAKLAAMKRLLEIDAISLVVEITPNSFGSHYAHYNTMDVQLHIYFNEDLPEVDVEWVESWCESLKGLIEEDVRSLSQKLASQGYVVFDSYYEEEYVADMLIGNEYEFTKDGSFWHHNSWVEPSDG